MISITAHVSGADIAREMVEDMEESAQFFPEFARQLRDDDIVELTHMLSDEVFADDRKTALRRLGEIFIKAAG